MHTAYRGLLVVICLGITIECQGGGGGSGGGKITDFFKQ
jgi:hypothetical protein